MLCICPFSSASLPGYVPGGLSDKSYNQCILLPQCCSKLESIRPLLLFFTSGYPTTKDKHTFMFGMLKDRHGIIRDYSPSPLTSETADSAEKCIHCFCSNCCPVLWCGICEDFGQRCDVTFLWLADYIYRLCLYLDTYPLFMIPTFLTFLRALLFKIFILFIVIFTRGPCGLADVLFAPIGLSFLYSLFYCSQRIPWRLL